jgi:hypothetical protein
MTIITFSSKVTDLLQLVNKVHLLDFVPYLEIFSSHHQLRLPKREQQIRCIFFNQKLIKISRQNYLVKVVKKSRAPTEGKTEPFEFCAQTNARRPY